MPRAYWMNESHPQLSAQVMLLEPSTTMFERLQTVVAQSDNNASEMDILSNIFYDSALVLPHRKYNLVTSELRKKDDEHSAYLGSDDEAWDVDAVMAEASYLHFSDWPVRKPWVTNNDWFLRSYAPACKKRKGQAPDCHQREIWQDFYSDFLTRRRKVCGIEDVN